MKGSELRKFDIDGVKMQFNREVYKRCVRDFSKKEKKKKKEYLEEMADKLYIPYNTLKSWEDNSGPGDVDKIKSVAEYFGMEYKRLLKKVDINKTDENYTDRQLESIRRIYGSIIEFIEEFNYTDGFNDYWMDFKETANNPEIEIEDYALKKVDAVSLVCKKEYFDLHDLKIYDKLMDFINDDLPDMFIGKCSYAYRMEAPVENTDGTISGVTTINDYEKALQSLHKIMEEYVW